MKKKSLFLYCTLLSCFLAIAQPNKHKNIWQIVLKDATVNKQFVFGKWSDHTDETRLKYLGTVKTLNGKTYKVMNSIWIWGLAKRATSRILIFNEKNDYVGNYYLTMTFDVPDKLEDGVLIFTNTGNPQCDSKLPTRVDLREGLPSKFFLKCKGDEGDLYSFSSKDEYNLTPF